MRRLKPDFLLALLFFCCSAKQSFDHQFFMVGKSQGIVDNPEINEASGLAVSMINDGMLWTHNDSGNDAKIFLIDEQAKCKATVSFEKLVNRDWEDIAVGPGPDEKASYIYIGDIGDNFSLHDYKYIYRVKEPRIVQSEDPVKLTVKNVDSIKFILPDGKRDSEALMIDPLTKDIYVFSKREKNVNLYMLPYPQSTTKVITAQFVLQLPLTQINSADISPDGAEVIIKNYNHVYYWYKTSDESLKELLKKKPALVPYVTEPQGESIAFDRHGNGYYTLSEEVNNKKPHLMFYQRRKKQE